MSYIMAEGYSPLDRMLEYTISVWLATAKCRPCSLANEFLSHSSGSQSSYVFLQGFKI